MINKIIKILNKIQFKKKDYFKQIVPQKYLLSHKHILIGGSEETNIILN